MINSDTYEELYRTLTNYDFDEITYDDVNDLYEIKDDDRGLINESFEILKIKKIEKFEEGIYFITGKSDTGNDGYFRSFVPKESLEDFTILSRIQGDWYTWYQD